jgi:hypothetical protein
MARATSIFPGPLEVAAELIALDVETDAPDTQV